MMIDILLATYNSERFLKNQINSILVQDFSDFRLLIRDGGSTDSTIELVKEYARKDSRISFIGSSRASAKENFAALLEAADGDLVMFSDHDDCWMPNKISMTLEAYRNAERNNPPGTPLLIFTDLQVVDSDWQCIHSSMMKYQHLNPERTALHQLLLQNVATGNTMLFNRALLSRILHVPKEIVMHDAWVALAASAFGKIVFLDKATIYYRQHQSNVFGASQYSLRFFINKLSGPRKAILDRFYENVSQGKSFLEHFRNELPQDTIAMLEDFSSLKSYGFWKKRFVLIKHRIYKTSFLRNLGMFLVL